MNDETLATDLMIEKGPGKDYLAEEHTIKHMRSEFFMPELANRDMRESAAPNSDALSRAKAFVASVRAADRKEHISAPVRDAILETFPEIRTLTND